MRYIAFGRIERYPETRSIKLYMCHWTKEQHLFSHCNYIKDMFIT